MAKTKTNARATGVTSKFQNQTVHSTFRRHFLPPLLGILTFIGVLGLFNSQWLVAQYEYRFSKPIVVGATEPGGKTDPRITELYIPSIDVDAPIVSTVRSYDQNQVQLALRRGVVQYGPTADPGQKGNTVIVGHSSGQVWAPGNYKFVFTLLDKVKMQDRIIIDYKGQRYIYRVDGRTIVPPTDISVLDNTTEPQLTLITCTPVGTSKNRLVIRAKQISPDPKTATEMPRDSGGLSATEIPR